MITQHSRAPRTLIHRNEYVSARACVRVCVCVHIHIHYYTHTPISSLSFRNTIMKFNKQQTNKYKIKNAVRIPIVSPIRFLGDDGYYNRKRQQKRSRLPLWANSLWSFAPNCIFCLVRRRCAQRACRFSNIADIWNRNGQRCSRFPFRRVVDVGERNEKKRSRARTHHPVIEQRQQRRRTARDRSISRDGRRWRRWGTRTVKDARTTSVAVAVVTRGASGGGGTNKKCRAAAAAAGRNDIILSFKK